MTSTASKQVIEFRASHRHAQMGARKARLVVDMIRGRSANEALNLLAHDRHRAAPYVRKVLASAVANALQNPAVKASRLVVSSTRVDGGPLLQGRMRWRAGPMGRAMPIAKRTCHIHVCVADPDVLVETDIEDTEPSGAAEPAEQGEE